MKRLVACSVFVVAIAFTMCIGASQAYALPGKTFCDDDGGCPVP